MKIITPVRPQSFKDLENLVKKIGNRADIIEIWLDEVCDEEDFFEKFADLAKKTIVLFLGVCKMSEEKGNFKGTTEERVEILRKFLGSGGDFVDMDVIRNPENLIKKLPSKKLFLSFHDFEGVPDDLNKILIQEQIFYPRIYKFAVTTNTEEELDNFLCFVRNFPKKHDGIFTTIGTLGTKGREKIAQTGRSWGGFYAVDEQSRTADGQQTLCLGLTKK